MQFIKMQEKISTKTELKKLIFIISLILVVAIVFILYLSWPLLTGKTIVLATHPVDPFDVFRGQYLTINYDISRVPVINGAATGDFVYVALEKDKDGIWQFKSDSLSKIDEPYVIKGEINYISSDSMSVKYGIEQYFFERHATFSPRNLTVEAKIDSSGNAKIVQLLQNGEPLKITSANITLTS